MYLLLGGNDTVPMYMQRGRVPSGFASCVGQKIHWRIAQV